MIALTLLYYFAPAFVANATPVVVKHIPLLRNWNTPIAPSLVGKNKTWRGLSTGIALAVLCCYGQFLLHELDAFVLISAPYHWDLGQSLLAGALMGSGALCGDLVKSFLKRRIGKKPGEAWPLIDGVDYTIGAVLFLSPLYVPNIFGILFIVFIGPILSLLANLFSNSVGWKEVWW